MKTQHIITTLTGIALGLITLGAVAGHEPPYQYNPAYDWVEFAYHGKPVITTEQGKNMFASTSPVYYEPPRDDVAGQASYDWFRDQ